jgi:enoyl-CoA hydratase
VPEQTDPVTTRDVDGIAVVAFDDGKANALSFETIDLLDAALADAASARAVVLTGRPGMFSAGLDLKIVRGGEVETTERLIRRIGELLHAVTAIPVPTVAACTGHSLAGGALLLLACDRRVGPAAADVKIGLTEVAVGLALPSFAHALARTRLARNVLVRATALAETIGVDEAVAWGYLDEVVTGDVVDVAVERARSLTALDPAALRLTKQMVYGT